MLFKYTGADSFIILVAHIYATVVVKLFINLPIIRLTTLKYCIDKQLNIETKLKIMNIFFLPRVIRLAPIKHPKILPICEKMFIIVL